MDLVYSPVYETDLGGSGGTQKLEFTEFLYKQAFNKGVTCVFSTDGNRRDGMDSEECIKQSNPNPIWWEMYLLGRGQESTFGCWGGGETE